MTNNILPSSWVTNSNKIGSGNKLKYVVLARSTDTLTKNDGSMMDGSICYKSDSEIYKCRVSTIIVI